MTTQTAPAGTVPAVSLKGVGPMTTTTTHAITAVVFKPADGSGNIDGWEATCACGFRTSNSLGQRWASRQGWDHVAYMQRKAGSK